MPVHGLSSTPRGLQADYSITNKYSHVAIAAARLIKVSAYTSKRSAVVVQSSARQAESSSAVVQRLALAGIEVPDSAAKRNPQLSLDSQEHITSKVEPMLEFLVAELAMQPQDIEIMLLRCPKLFSFNVDRQCRPVVAFLGSLGLNQQQVSATIKRFPHMLGYDTKGHLVPHCHYLKSLGVTDEELPQLILARPHVLGMSIELVITYLRKWLRIGRTNVGKLLWSYPLDYSLPRLVMPSKIGTWVSESVEATTEDDTAQETDANSSSGGSNSTILAQQDGGSSSSQEPEQRVLPPLGSPDRCTWLNMDAGSDNSNSESS